MKSSTLQAEIRKRKPFDLPEQEAHLNLLRTGEVLAFPFEQLFAERGLPGSEIGVQMITRMPDMTRLIDRLEEARLVRRCRSDEDRRVVRICLTDEGRSLLARLDGPVRELHEQTLGHLARGELAELNRLLMKARNFARN